MSNTSPNPNAATSDDAAWRHSVDERFAAGARRMDSLQDELACNTAATQQVAANTAEMVAMFQAWQGAFRVLESLGKLAKPLGQLVALGAALAGVWAAIKHGHLPGGK